MSHSYPSDISREQFDSHSSPSGIGPPQDQAPHRGLVRRFLRGALLTEERLPVADCCQADFPDWRTCYKYFRQWSERPSPEDESILEQVLKKSVGEARQSNGRTEQTSFCIVDSQSVRNTDSAEQKGYDAGKKVSGNQAAHRGRTPRDCPMRFT